MSNKKPIILGDKPMLTISTPPILGMYPLSDIDWRVEFFASQGSVTIHKNEAVKVDDNTYTVRVDTFRTGTGKLRGILYPSIPDDDVPGGCYTPPVPFAIKNEDGVDEMIVSPYYMGDGLSNC